MGLSVGALNSTTYGVRPMQYALQNQSQVSSAYAESLADAKAVSNVSPVKYPDSQLVKQSGNVQATASAKEVNASFNKIASAYTGATTGYNEDRTGYGYDMVGSNFDMYA